MVDLDDLDIGKIANLDEAIDMQMKKLQEMRDLVKSLQFVPVDPAGDYIFVSYKAVDSSRLRINFSPLEIEFINVSDSNDKTKLQFAYPRGEDLDKGDLELMINSLADNIPILKDFVSLLGEKQITDLTEIIKDPDALREISEWACIYDRIMNSEDPTLVIKEGLLRTKKLKYKLIEKLLKITYSKKSSVKLVGVSRTSRIMSMISTALSIQKKFPQNKVGYIKIPKNLELMAYSWTGRGKIKEGDENRLYFAFGDLYIAKLAPNSNLLVTIEVPSFPDNDKELYTKTELNEIMGHLIRNSRNSYPIIGYPQTLIRANESAQRIGFPAKILSDRVREVLKNKLDSDGIDYMRDADMIDEYVSKGIM